VIAMTTPRRAEWARVVPPALEPITLADVKAQARITHDDADPLLTAYIQAARETAESTMNRGLLTQTWELVLDQFYEEMWLPRAHPLQAVTAITYYDADGTLQTLAPTFYTVETVSRPGRVVRAAGYAWPPLQADRLAGRVIIRYVVGWETVEDVPERIKQGIRLFVTYLDRDRDGSTLTGESARAAAEACWDDIVTWPDVWPIP
jgi:uncharacterized phiE125 gp8 family phage protein